MPKSEIVDVEVDLIHETDKAYLVDAGTSAGEVWIPKSVAEYDARDKTITLPRSFAEWKGLV